MSDDPFDDIEDDPDRQGDPFAEIDEEESTDSLFEPSQTASDDTEPTAGDDPFSDLDPGHGQPSRGRSDDEGIDAEGSPTGERPDPTEDDPFADLGQAPAEDPFEDFGAGGASVDDDVWDDLSREPTSETVTEARGERRYSAVSKHSFCEQCEHFSAPPGVACAHQGTEILEFLDMETVRVVDCPVVEEREQLESGHQ